MFIMFAVGSTPGSSTFTLQTLGKLFTHMSHCAPTIKQIDSVSAMLVTSGGWESNRGSNAAVIGTGNNSFKRDSANCAITLTVMNKL